MEQVNSKYEAALLGLMKWADAQSAPDVESGWPTDEIISDQTLRGRSDFRLPGAEGLDARQLDTDFKSMLIEKAIGTVHTRVLNSMSMGGVHAYIDVYKHFTETSGIV